MRIIPVIDIREGIAVRGVAGQRETYRPVQSRYTSGCRVIDVATALRDHFGFQEFYLADLDAIEGSRMNRTIYRDLLAADFSLLVDAGLNNAETAASLFQLGVPTVIAGLETLPHFSLLQELVRHWGSERIVFSLDLQQGRPLLSETMTATFADRPVTAASLAEMAVAAGIRRLIVLDLAAVGTGEGLSTLPLCRDIRARFPQVDLITGGGVRHSRDLRQLEAAGIGGVLIASALHNGSLLPEALSRWLSPVP